MVQSISQHSTFFGQEVKKIDVLTQEFLSKFDNGWLDHLIEEWYEYYFYQQNPQKEEQVISNKESFKNELKKRIVLCLDYLRNPHKKNNWREIEKIQWYRDNYQGLLYWERVPVEKEDIKFTKQEELIEKVWARIKTLDSID